MEELKMMSHAFFGTQPSIRFKSLTGQGGDAPPSLEEKKNLEEASRKQELRDKALGHPAINAALDVFGGEVGEVVELK